MRAAAVVLAAFCVVMACDTASLFHPPAESPAALLVGLSGARASRAQPDAAYIRVTAAGGAVLFGDTVAIAGTGEARVRIELDLTAESQSVDVLVELFEAGRLVERGSLTVTLRQGEVTTASVFADDIADDLAVGPNHACYLDAAGDAYCWGSGAGSGLDPAVGAPGTSRPVRVASSRRFVALTAGGRHTCALDEVGTAHCWGENTAGQLGDGTATARYSPAPVSGSHTFEQITAGEIHTCGLTDAGEALCWGNNGNAELGIGTMGGNSTTPIPVATQLRFDGLQAGFTYSCGIVAGQAWCWGRNFGLGGLLDTTPRQMTSGGPYVVAAPGVTASCVLTEAGAAECWGAQGYAYGQLGNGTLTSSPTPVPVSGNITFASINSASANNIFTAHVCGLDVTGRGWCWGNNRYGELGSSNAADLCPIGVSIPNFPPFFSCSLVPVPVTTNQRFVAVGLGLSYSCALSNEGRVYCWGRGKSGGLGTGDLQSRSVPTPIGAPTGPPILSSYDIVLGQSSVTVGDSIAGFLRSLDQNGLWIPAVGSITVSDTTVARVLLAPDLIQHPAGGFFVHGLSRGSAVLSTTFGGIMTQTTVTVN